MHNLRSIIICDMWLYKMLKATISRFYMFNLQTIVIFKSWLYNLLGNVVIDYTRSQAHNVVDKSWKPILLGSCCFPSQTVHSSLEKQSFMYHGKYYSTEKQIQEDCKVVWLCYGLVKALLCFFTSLPVIIRLVYSNLPEGDKEAF